MSRATAAATDAALRGSVLDVLAELLREQRTDEVLVLVNKLVARNHELERRLAQILSRKKPGKVSRRRSWPSF